MKTVGTGGLQLNWHKNLQAHWPFADKVGHPWTRQLEVIQGAIAVFSFSFETCMKHPWLRHS